MSEPLPTRPVPVPDADSRPFWEGVENHELRIQRCRTCSRHIYYPRSLCPYCHGTELDWVQASGSGVLYSYTISRRPAGPGFAADVPYVVALVDLDEGPRMMTNLVDVPVDDVTIGQRVRVDFREMSPGLTLPVFRPA